MLGVVTSITVLVLKGSENPLGAREKSRAREKKHSHQKSLLSCRNLGAASGKNLMEKESNALNHLGMVGFFLHGKPLDNKRMPWQAPVSSPFSISHFVIFRQ